MLNWIVLNRTDYLHKERKREACNTRKEETILSRLGIGHTRLTYDFILKEESPPKCPCRNHYTNRHILIECTNLSCIRKKNLTKLTVWRNYLGK